MSSNRGAGPCDATVLVNDKQVGVIRLPENRPDDFIEHFNRTYSEIGMSLNPLPAEIPNDDTEQKKSPPANDADGDFVD